MKAETPHGHARGADTNPGIGTTTIVMQLAEWVAALKFDDLPVDAIESAKLAVLDQIGIQVLGSTLPWMRPYRELIETHSGQGESTVMMSPTRRPLRDAVFLNAAFGQSCELDDHGGPGHPGTVVIPVAVGLGELSGRSGRDVLTAIVAGYEVNSRVLSPISPAYKKRGFQGTGLGGPFAAAATAAKLMGLDPMAIAHSLSIAGSSVTGLAEYDQSGGEVKRIYAGNAARNGVDAALLAQRGLTGPMTILEGRKGFFQAFGGPAMPDNVTVDLGQDLRIVRRRVKPYPTVGTIHAAIDAFGALVDTHHLQLQDITAVRVSLSPIAVMHGGTIRRPVDVVSAQFSLAFSLGLRLLYGRNHLDQYRSPEIWADPRIVAITELVEVIPDEDAVGELRSRAIVEVDTRNTTLRQVVVDPRGSTKNPLSAAEQARKYDELVDGVLALPVATRLREAIARLDELESIEPILRDLRSEVAGPATA